MKKLIASLASFTLLGCIFFTTARAAGDPLGLYMGAGVGQANSQYGFFNDGLPGADHFDGHQFGWNAVLGIRPISWLGAELEYIDFGNAQVGAASAVVNQNGVSGGQEALFYGATGHARAVAGFAVGYLPLPLPWVDVFGKLGVAHLWAPYSASGQYPCLYENGTCSPFPPFVISESDSATRPAYGGGAQIKFGAFAVRAEYERISYSTGDPNLLSIGATWQF